jgi:phosphatidylglycerol lysyltransferase
MIQLVAPLAVVAALGGVTHRLLRAGWQASRSRKSSSLRRRLTSEEILGLVREYGRSANSFMTLYPGFEYFAHPDPSVRGMIAFVETPGAWVGGAEPFCAPGHAESILGEFAAAAQALGKTAMMLPVDEKHATLARQAGYQAVMIGSEPTWDFERFPRTGRTWSDVVPTAKSLAGKGARVTEFVPSRLTPEARSELDQITREWLGTRKMDALSFLNQVDPWFRQEDKRYFRVEHQGRTLAFLAAIPVWARGAWYLIDLIRRSDSPPGATELLLLQSMRSLRESGALEATMGVAPLSNIEAAPKYPCAEFAKNRRTYSLLRFIYERGNAFYNFKPLHQYKLKFDPSSSPPAFLIYKPALGLGPLLGLSRAFMPGGMVRATWSGTLRMASRFSLAEWIRAQLSTRAVVRSVPPSWPRLLRRCKLTVALLVLNLAAYFASADSDGVLPGTLEARWGFSWSAFTDHPARALLLSPFLHWNLLHLCLNLLVLVIFTGGLEYLAGTGIAALCYLVPMLAANPVTAALIAALHAWIPSMDPSEIDIGASLGIFGCAGALGLLLRWGRWLVAGLCAGAILDAGFSHLFMPLNHIVAAFLGLLLGWAAMRG